MFSCIYVELNDQRCDEMLMTSDLLREINVLQEFAVIFL